MIVWKAADLIVADRELSSERFGESMLKGRSKLRPLSDALEFVARVEDRQDRAAA
jgi:hypothetical protein